VHSTFPEFQIIDDYETKQNFTELLHLSCYAAACPFFNENGYLVVTYRMLMVAAIWAKQPKVLWTLVRTVFHDEKDTRVWNLYGRPQFLVVGDLLYNNC